MVKEWVLRVTVAAQRGLDSGWYSGESQRSQSHNNKRLVTVLGDSIQLEKSSSENGPKITFLITLVDSLVCLVASCGACCNNSFVC
jgi:hypothetical protein